MRARDSVTQDRLLRAGPAVLVVGLAALVLSVAPISSRLEGWVYDTLQSRLAGPGSPDIVMVDTAGLPGGGSAWNNDRFPDLLLALGSSGARLILAVEPPPVMAPLPDAGQLATLADLEQRTRGDSPGSRARAEAFARQLADMRRRADLQERTIAAGGVLRNLVVPVPTFDGGRSAQPAADACTKHVFTVEPESSLLAETLARPVRAVTALPDGLCRAVLAAGHGEFWADDDGTVRRLDLLVNASGALVPSAALRAAVALSFPSGTPPSVDTDAIRWDDRAVATSGSLATLLRFYRAGAGDGGPFPALDAQDILRGGDRARAVAGKIVVLGPATAAAGDPAYATAVASRAPPAELLATAVSNLVQGDYVARPAWLGWVETLLLVLLAAGALLAGNRVPAAAGLALAAAIALALLGIEALLFARAGLWAELATPAAFVLLVLPAMRILQARVADDGPLAVLAAAPGGGAIAAGGGGDGGETELDRAFSVLRQQAPSENVKGRLYDIALEHARRRDLAKAERVLRHLAGIDPDYRKAGEKLKKLAGLREPAAQPVAEPAPVPVPPRADGGALTGRTIGRYQIEQPIGRGAMATVYLGRDPKINRRVAIKTIALAEEFTEDDLVNARTQFLREAESAGRLNHPNIISIYDAGEDGQVAYLAMEYFPGKPLSHYAQPGQLLPPRLAFELMARAAEALHYAHGQHVVHRDVKPANLLYDRSSDLLKITDFGIARLTDTSRTKTGIILGTPSYMSPEQLAGTNVTGQSDLFSLGITLYQLLAGHPPFRADSIPKLMQKIAHERHESVRVVRDDLPRAVDALFDRALAKDPADRFPSGRAMALALRECCSSLGSPASTIAP